MRSVAGQEATLLDLIGHIYSAAEDSSRWDSFLLKLADVARARVGAIAFEDLRSHKARVATIVGVDSDLIRQYEEYYAERNSWMVPAMARFGSGAVMTSEMVLPDRDLIRTEYYDGFLHKLGVRHFLGTFVFREPNVLSHLSFLRSHRAGECAEAETRLFGHLIPHLQRAFQLHRRLVDMRTEYELAVDALDRVPVGILLLDGKGKALLVNRSAREILSARDGLALQNDGLQAATPEQTSALRRLISRALATGTGKGHGSGGVLAVSRPSFRRPYSLFVSPLRAERSAFGEPGAVAAVFISDPERKPETSPEVLQRLYGFTPAESRVAAKLLEGESVEEAAEELDVSVNTARTHVKSMFEKTDTHRHRELLRILLSGVATIRTD